MRRAFISSFIALGLLLIAISCRSGGDLSKPETQRQFGVRMAKMNLWREAMFRFRRAVDIDPSDAMAHNNLAVALEANGDFEAAAKEYREALRLDRSNQYIQKNYSRYVEFMQRSKKRDAAKTAAATTTTTTTAATTTTTTPAAPPAAPPTATDTAAPATTEASPPPTTTNPPATTTNPPATTTTNPPAGDAR